MDPNEALKQLREAIGKFETWDLDDYAREDLRSDLVLAFEALDGWLTKGGFLPDDWNHAPELVLLRCNNDQVCGLIGTQDDFEHDEGRDHPWSCGSCGDTDVTTFAAKEIR